MEEHKLISMTYFVENIRKMGVVTPFPDEQDKIDLGYLQDIFNYASFLKQPLKLGMFVPCDENGNILNDPGLIPSYELERYRKAKEKVLFEGFEIKISNITNNLQNDFLIISETNEIIGHENKDQWFFNPYKKVEDLIPYDLTLTESAIKQLGL